MALFRGCHPATKFSIFFFPHADFWPGIESKRSSWSGVSKLEE
ncbi:hypothetical protein CJP42_3145 [Salmonella enterica subsp. enterica serovar Typhi]|nr:hypothetical protein CJP42_3145 [Salmonella enterica subsp. enterica serovar Typhi]